MTRQSMFQAKKESQPLKTSSLFRRQAAQAPVEEREAAALPVNLGRDFSGIPFKPVHPAPALGPSSISCPFTPERCPFGGACHACPPKMQAKLKIGQPGDRYEQEADRVAEQVMRMPEPQVQRKCSAPGCKDEEEKKLLQTKPASAEEAGAQVDHPLIQSVLSSPGQPLDAATRSFMEPRFGQDFSGVRVHLGSEAAESARAVNARAYTVGRDVVFGEGQYAPGSGEGRRLMAHELAHVGQQSFSFAQIQRQQRGAAALPASLRTAIGNLNYYRLRNNDYLRRHTTPPPPDYYLNYGNVYARRFTIVLRPNLSAQGQRWVDRTLRLLQEAIENRRDRDIAAFDLLEQDSERFREFAYGTHQQAYLDGGLRYLPVGDLYKIATTPDIGDLLTIDGIGQMIGTGIAIIPQWAGNVVDSAASSLSQMERQMEREIYRLYGVPYF